MKLWRNLAVVTLGLGVLAGCTTNPYTGEREAGKAGIYGGVGAVTGAVIGAATSSKKDRGKGALIGAAVGGAAGGGGDKPMAQAHNAPVWPKRSLMMRFRSS